MNANDAILNANAATAATNPRYDASRVIRAPRGSELHCKNWLAEAAYRMLQNNLDAEVAERPQDRGTARHRPQNSNPASGRRSGRRRSESWTRSWKRTRTP